MIWEAVAAVWCAVAVAGVGAADKWKWPEGSSSAVRIDTKVKFLGPELPSDSRKNYQQDEELTFQAATDTQGFYNRPANLGRYPVRVEVPRAAPPHTRDDVYVVQNNAGETQHCRCVSNLECNTLTEAPRTCGVGKTVCCEKRRRLSHNIKPEFFNEVEDERPNLYPGQTSVGGAFPPPADVAQSGFFPQGHEGPYLGVLEERPRPILVGPGGPTGSIGPNRQPGRQQQPQHNRPAVLVGPDGPTGIIGPAQQHPAQLAERPRPDQHNPAVLVGPGGPTGIVGPAQQHSAQLAERPRPDQHAPAVLVGPGGPTGHVGPQFAPTAHNDLLAGPDDFRHSETAQRGVLVGPGGPTGMIGPNRRPVLVGPEGPTGIIGPAYGRRYQPNYFFGPGNAGGYVNSRRPVLVGPGGPTGIIGPRRTYYGK